MLILAHNYIKHIPAKVFRHLPLLNSLELDGNQISSIDEEAFFGLEGKNITLNNIIIRKSYFYKVKNDKNYSQLFYTIGNYIRFKRLYYIILHNIFSGTMLYASLEL